MTSYIIWDFVIEIHLRLAYIYCELVHEAFFKFYILNSISFCVKWSFRNVFIVPSFVRRTCYTNIFYDEKNLYSGIDWDFPKGNLLILSFGCFFCLPFERKASKPVSFLLPKKQRRQNQTGRNSSCIIVMHISIYQVTCWKTKPIVTLHTDVMGRKCDTSHSQERARR